MEDIKKIMYFTKRDTVYLGDKEIENKEFFDNYDKLKDQFRYSVKYDEKWNEFNVIYDNKEYIYQLNNREIEELEVNPNTKHLYDLANIEKMNKKSNELITTLDEKTQLSYLEIFNKRKISPINYLENLVSDFKGCFKAWYKVLKENHNLIKEPLQYAKIVTIGIGIYVVFVTSQPLLILLAFPEVYEVAFGVSGSLLLFGLARAIRLAHFISNKKIKRKMVKGLKKELSNSLNVTKEKDDKDLSPISGVLNDLIESFKEIKAENSEALASEIDNLLTEYHTALNEQKLTDTEIFSKIVSKVANLQLKIGEEKKKMKEAEKRRIKQSEVKYLRNKLHTNDEIFDSFITKEETIEEAKAPKSIRLGTNKQ